MLTCYVSVIAAAVRFEESPHINAGRIISLRNKFHGSGFIESKIANRCNLNCNQVNAIRKHLFDSFETRKKFSRRRQHGLQMKRMKKSEINDLVTGMVRHIFA
jgi:hypothetical protein